MWLEGPSQKYSQKVLLLLRFHYFLDEEIAEHEQSYDLKVIRRIYLLFDIISNCMKNMTDVYHYLQFQLKPIKIK